MDKYRPSQETPIPNFFLAGSYTYQVRQHAAPREAILPARGALARTRARARVRSLALCRPPPPRTLSACASCLRLRLRGCVQDYIDSMEGATKSGLACAEAVLEKAEALAAMADAAK